MPDNPIIFLLEDTAELGQALTEALTDSCLLQWFTDPDLLISHEQVQQASIFILDIGLPKSSGLVVLQQIRAMPQHARTPVIMLTNSEHPEAIASAVEHECTAYIVKANTSLSDLIKTIYVYLEK